MEKITVTIQMNKDMYEKIRKEAYDKNVSNSEVIRQACDQYFENKALDNQLIND